MRRTRLNALTPRCAAAAAAVIAGLAITGMAVPGHPASSAAASGPPRYYADIEGEDSLIVIRATATGKIIDTYLDRSGGLGALTASRDNRTFYFVEDGQPTATVKTFRITASGKITGLHAVRGGTITADGGAVDSIAVSPDGSRLAAGEFFDPSPSGSGGPVADLIVIDLRTGKQTVWQGIRRKNWPVSIPSVSWTPDGRSVVYLMQWCSHGLMGTDTCFGAQYAEVWSLDASSHGGALASHGHRLLAQSARYPVIQQALASARSGAVIVMVLSGKLDTQLAIDLVSVPAGKTLAVLYRGVTGLAVTSASLSADGSQAYLLLADGIGAHHGWIHDGHLHLLPPTNGDGDPMAW